MMKMYIVSSISEKTPLVALVLRAPPLGIPSTLRTPYSVYIARMVA